MDHRRDGLGEVAHASRKACTSEPHIGGRKLEASLDIKQDAVGKIKGTRELYSQGE